MVPTHSAMADRPSRFRTLTGSVLDPIVAIRRTREPATGGNGGCRRHLGIAETWEGGADSRKISQIRMADRVLDLAWTHGRVILRQLNVTEAEAQLYARTGGEP